MTEPVVGANPGLQATNLLSTLESMVLLSNPGELLPIKAGKKVALIGPHANAREGAGELTGLTGLGI